MDSSSSWSPADLTSEPFPPLLDAFLAPVTREYCAKDGFLTQFCASTTEEEEGLSSGLSSETLTHHDCSIKASFPTFQPTSFFQDSHLSDSSQCLNSEIHDGFRSAVKSRHAEDNSSNSMLSPSQSENYCKNEPPKRIKSDQAGSQSKAQSSQSQVRRLGEKITALQQLVSPFGKTDTASVLLEAIGYIKFLQEQVHVLSLPYMTSNVNRKGCEAGTDLRSRGLCLVPISCTRNVTNNNGADYWISGISGCSR